MRAERAQPDAEEGAQRRKKQEGSAHGGLVPGRKAGDCKRWGRVAANPARAPARLPAGGLVYL
jgi:hypothetical protein